MPRLLKVLLPYVAGAVGALVIFAAGVYSSFYLTGMLVSPRFGVQQVAEMAQDHNLLQSLDAGRVDEARSLLITNEDIQIMSLDMLAPYLPDDLAKTTCRIMQKVAQERANNAAKYAAAETSDPAVRKIVAASLQNPAACARK
jgi:hypothetical protein